MLHASPCFTVFSIAEYLHCYGGFRSNLPHCNYTFISGFLCCLMFIDVHVEEMALISTGLRLKSLSTELRKSEYQCASNAGLPAGMYLLKY
jgi:hypothetical protein